MQVSKVLVSYVIEDSPRSLVLDSMEDAESFVSSLLEMYGEEHVHKLIIERVE